MVVGATAKDTDMPKSRADGEAEPASAFGQRGRPGAHTSLCPEICDPQPSGGRHETSRLGHRAGKIRKGSNKKQQLGAEKSKWSRRFGK